MEERALGNHNVPIRHRLGEPRTAEIQKVTAASRAPDEIIASKKCSDTNDTGRGTRTCTPRRRRRERLALAAAADGGGTTLAVAAKL